MNKKQKILFFSLFLTCHFAFSQKGKYIDVILNQGFTDFKQVELNSNGEYCVIGTTNFKSNAGKNILVAKYSQSGELLKEKNIGRSADDSPVNAVISNDVIIIAGNTSIKGNSEGVLIALNQNFKNIWYKSFINKKILGIYKTDKTDILTFAYEEGQAIKSAFINLNGDIYDEKLITKDKVVTLNYFENNWYLSTKRNNNSYLTKVSESLLSSVPLSSNVDIFGLENDENGILLYGSTDTKENQKESYFASFSKETLEKQWDQTYGGEEDDVITAVVKNNKQGYYLLGHSKSYEDRAIRTACYLLEADVKGQRLGEVKFMDRTRQNDFVNGVLISPNGNLVYYGNENNYLSSSNAFLTSLETKVENVDFESETVVFQNFMFDKYEIYADEEVDLSFDVINDYKPVNNIGVIFSLNNGNTITKNISIKGNTKTKKISYPLRLTSPGIYNKDIILIDKKNNTVLQKVAINLLVKEVTKEKLEFIKALPIQDSIANLENTALSLIIKNSGNKASWNSYLIVSEIDNSFTPIQRKINCGVKQNINISIDKINLLKKVSNKLFINVALYDSLHQLQQEKKIVVVQKRLDIPTLIDLERVQASVSNINASLNELATLKIQQKNNQNSKPQKDYSQATRDKNSSQEYKPNVDSNNAAKEKEIVNGETKEWRKDVHNPASNGVNIKESSEEKSKNEDIANNEKNPVSDGQDSAKNKKEGQKSEKDQHEEPQPTTSGTIMVFWEKPSDFNAKKIIVENDEISISAIATSTNELSKSNFSIFVNEVQELSGQKFDKVKLSSTKQNNGYLYRYEDLLKLKMGNNKVYIKVQNEAGAIKTKEIEIFYEPAKPNLFLYSFGVPHEDLKYTTKDAKDFTRAISNATKGVFGFIDTVTYSNNFETTAGQISRTLAKINQQAKQDNKFTPKDVLIIFVSSHGEIEDGEYLIRGSDYDQLIKDKTCINVEKEILARLNDIKCKKLLLFDACQVATRKEGTKGSKEEESISSEAMLKILSSQIGTSTLFSCNKGQYSYEDDKWQNGAFTEAIIEALSTHSSASDKNNDNIITLSELHQYIQTRVPSLVSSAKNKDAVQTPVIINYGLDNLPIGVR